MENTGNKWSEKDIEFLNKFYPTSGVKYCSEQLKRNRDGVETKARRLGIASTRITHRYSKDNMEPIVNESKSLKEVLEKMGLKAAGGNYQVIKDYISKYEFSIEHFETIKEKNERTGFKTIEKTLESILVENSSYSRQPLKIRLIKEKLLEYKCVSCGNTGEWNGKPISLQLDHENGINNDNRIENLRFLCPNCHSQTPTYAGKNKNSIIV
jgi:Zn finger protein HypA/HybF involved in hydrogenase expression